MFVQLIKTITLLIASLLLNGLNSLWSEFHSYSSFITPSYHNNGNIKYPIGTLIFAGNFTLKLFRITIADADIGRKS